MVIRTSRGAIIEVADLDIIFLARKASETFLKVRYIFLGLRIAGGVASVKEGHACSLTNKQCTL